MRVNKAVADMAEHHTERTLSENIAMKLCIVLKHRGQLPAFTDIGNRQTGSIGMP